MKKNKIIALIICAFSYCSCSDFLDVIPDNVATINHAFNNRVSAERYLFGCYSYLPSPTDLNSCAGMLGSRECWLPLEGIGFLASEESTYAWNIARGYQTANDPLLNYWDGGQGGSNLFTALRDCNTFLENIHKPIDLGVAEKDKWVAEAKFLKAYYHFFLLRMYGPIPVIAENLPVSSTSDEVRVHRDPVEKVASYIVELLDEAAEDLPLEIQNPTQDMGRITRPVALALKAKTLMLLASPLFNGNVYYRNVGDNRGTKLFPENEDKTKWVAAATAVKEAIECAHEAGHELYYYKGFNPVSDDTKKQLNVRCAVTDRWNSEIIWGSTKNSNYLQQISAARTNSSQFVSSILSMLSPTLGAAERFYSNNGVPIDEDKFYDYENRYTTSIVEEKDKYFMKPGFETANLHFNREIRFYASLCFDGSVLYGNGLVADDPADLPLIEMKKGKSSGMSGAEKYSITGYLPKKLVHIESTVENDIWTVFRYSFPYIRLADLYLMYAEALNETKETPDADVYFYIDEVRKRASLKGVEESWRDYSTRPDDATTQSGMRKIIHRERLIELAFEGEAYWDLLRWKEAEKEMSKPITGWNVRGENTADFYEIKTIAQSRFGVKDYLTPLKQEALDRNPNLVQNYGW
jgi:hypothetical protein